MSKSKLCSWLLYKRMRWTKEVTEPLPDKFILCMAPHTSNWDFIIGVLYMYAEDFSVNFMMKREWFRGPLGKLFRRLGGIPVRRDKHSHLTDSLAAEAVKADIFRLCITPEGTRSLNPDWKKGFYYIAQKAEIPILLFTSDYEKRVIRCTKTIIPSGDIESDMHLIKLYYKDCKGKHPERFTVGDID